MTKCIRILADVNQIHQCKKDLLRIENHTKGISNILGLAGNEVRLKILFLIHQEGELCPCDLSDILNMTVPAVSQHLRKLKDAGMVRDKKVGQTVFYSMVKENTKIIQPILKSLDTTNKEVFTQ